MERNIPRISIIVPVYQVEKYIRRTLDSIKEQSYSDIEIILVDDGSTDRSGEICDEYALKDNRIIVIHQANKGSSAARNKGLEIAKGDYISFIDSDDYIDSHMIEMLYETICKNNADISICDYQAVLPNNECLRMRKESLNQEIIDRITAMSYANTDIRYVVVWNKLYNRKLFENVRFPENILIGEDTAIIHRLYYGCNQIAQVPEKLYFYVQNPDSITRSNVTIKNLDDIEARYQRLKFFEEKGMTNLVDDTVCSMINVFIRERNKIGNLQNNDKSRVREIKRMVRYGYFKYHSKVRFADIINVEWPRLYDDLRIVKNRILHLLKV